MTRKTTIFNQLWLWIETPGTTRPTRQEQRCKRRQAQGGFPFMPSASALSAPPFGVRGR